MGKFSLAEHIQAAQPPAPRDIKTITEKFLNAKRKAGESIVEMGEALIEAKATLSHGEWLLWLTKWADFSEDTAENYMKLARKYTNSETLRNLGYSKALMLLALPDGERDEFIAVPHVVDGKQKAVDDMSTRELRAALKERDAALKAAEQAKVEQDVAEQACEKLSQALLALSEKIRGVAQG